MKLIKLMRPGRFTAMNGEVVVFTETDLKATAAAYNPAVYAAPFVLGHPKHDDPAYGKLGATSFTDGFLQGEPARVDLAFAEAVNAGKFDRVSLSLYKPDSPNNPVPGVYYPRHVGFLGAMPPAVKGLGTVSFAAAETGVLEFGDWNDRTIAGIFRSMRNWMIEKFGLEEANKAMNEWDVQSVADEAARPDPPAEISPEPAFAEHQQGGAAMLTPAQIAAKELEFEQREKNLKSQENAKTHTGNVEFAEGLVQAGTLLPAKKAALVAVLDFASGITEGGTIEFGEGDAKKNEAPLDTLKALFAGMPKIIEFAELGGGADPAAQQKAAPADLAKYV